MCMQSIGHIYYTWNKQTFKQIAFYTSLSSKKLYC